MFRSYYQSQYKIYYWVKILSNQRYRTLSTHNIKLFCCELNEPREVYYVISHSWYGDQRIYVFLNKVGSHDQNFHWYNENIHQYCITTFIILYLIIYPVIEKSHSRVSSTRRFLFYMRVFNYLRPNPYISNISNIYNMDQKLIRAYQIICDHMFSDLKSDYKFQFFCYVLGLYFVYFRM